MYNPTGGKTYEDDIDSLCYAKSDNDLIRWLNNTEGMVKKLIMTPDPTKPDPQDLIDKLEKRANTMKVHLKKRGCLGNIPPTPGIAKPTTNSNLPTIRNIAEAKAMLAMATRYLEIHDPQPLRLGQVPQEARVPPPHLRVSRESLEHSEDSPTDTLLCPETLSQRMEEDGKVYIK